MDWTAPDAEPLLLARGEIGDVATQATGFTAELRGATALMDRPVVEQTSPECRATLGDRRCRIDLAPRQRTLRVVAVDGADIRVDAVEPADNAYGQGRLRWLDGANGAIDQIVLRSAADIVTLADPPVFAVEAGTRLLLTEGCDRRLETCAGRFANAVNFRGEPHLPGNDLLTRYPGL